METGNDSKDLTFNYSENININYRIYGNGPLNIFCIHGYGSSLKTWLDIKDKLATTVKLFLIDLKGFGLSSRPNAKNYTPKDHALIAASFIKEQNLPGIILMGHSYGGSVLLEILLLLKKNFKNIAVIKLILIDPAVYIEKLPFLLFRLKEPFLKNLIIDFIPAKLIATISLRRMFVDKQRITKERINNYAYPLKIPGSKTSYKRTAIEMYPYIKDNIEPYIKNIKEKTLIIWGEKDPLIPLEHGYILNREISNSKLHIIKNCGHAPQEEKPGETSEIILKFIND